MILTTLISAVETRNLDEYLIALGFTQDEFDIPILNVYKQKIDLPDTIPITLKTPLPPHTISPTVSVDTVQG